MRIFMAYDDQTQRPFRGGAQPGPGAYYPQGYAPYGYGSNTYGPQPGVGPERRIDALDVLEGVLTDGFSVSNLTRIARASGSNFWVGAAIGAGLVMLAHRSEMRLAVAAAFSKAKAGAARKTPRD
jgi:hypothetical protein